MNGYCDIAQALIAAGADAQARDTAGNTPQQVCKTDAMKASATKW